MNDKQQLLIAAYHDGELDAAGGMAAEKLIAADPEAKDYWEALQQTDRALRAAFDPILSEPIPASIQAIVQKRKRRQLHQLAMPMALAASLALVAVLVVRQETRDQQMHDQLTHMQEQVAQLRYQTLENMPSGTAASWVAPVGNTRARVTPIKTYRTKENQFCREYEERIEDAKGVEVRRGIACRAGKSLWPDLTDASTSAGGDVGGGGSRGINL